MTVDPYILTFSALTVAATIWMGFWAARKSKTAHDFYVAGRSVSVGWNASAISGEYLSAASFMGVAGMVMSVGYDALWYPVCYACGYLFLLLFIAGPLRRFGAYTIPDFAEGRYDSPIFRKIAVVFVLFIGFFYTMPQMKGAGTTLAYIFPGLPYWAGVVLVGAVITLNVALGGMKGITLVQAFQYWAKMFAISVPIFVLMAVYGHYGKQVELNAPFQKGALPALPMAGPGALHYYHNTPSSQLPYLFRVDAPGYKFNPVPAWKLHLGAFLQGTLHIRPTGRFKGLAVSGIAGVIERERFRRTHGPPPGSHFDTSGLPLFELIDLYGMIKGKTSVAAGTAQQLEVKVQWTNQESVCGTAALRVLGGVLRQNGFVLYEESADQVVFAHTNLLVPNEKRLPAKAPTDVTWVSPFGPLTTKAAKAAAAALTNRAEFMGKIPLRADLSPDRKMTVNLDLADTNLIRIPEALLIYEDLTGRKQLPRTETLSERMDDFSGGRLSRWHWVKRTGPRALDHISYHVDGLWSATEVKDWVERVFKNSGIVIYPDGDKHFRAIKVSDGGSSGQTTAEAFQKAWLQTHERPLALLYTYSLIIALVCGTAGLPHILVRFYTNPDGVAAKRTTMWVMILIGVFYVFPPIFGVLGRNLLPELYSAVGAKGTDKIVLELPRLLNERYAPMGSVLSGITCAGAFAAFMSTFSGLLVSMTGALAHDVYGRMLRPQSTPDQRMKAFKICAVAVGGVAIFLGMQVEPFQINFMVGQAFAIAAASYFPLLFMSAWWRGMTMRGAATGMLTGGLLALTGISLTSFTDLKWLPLDAFWAAHPLLRILCEQPAIWAVPLAIALMVVVSKLTQREIPVDIRMKMLVLHAPEKLGLKQEYIAEHVH
jgi:Na+(H+)/acetate symporter ActP